VDTGRARAAWYTSMKGLAGQFDFSSGVGDENKVAEGKKQGKFIDKTKNRFNKYVELINAVKYILFLEFGSSQQAPGGMVRISMRKMRGKLPKSLGKEYKKDWNKIVKGKV